MHAVTDEVSQYQGEDHHRGHFLENNQECAPERDVCGGFQQREDGWYHNGYHDGGDERECRHGIDITPQLAGDYRGCRGTGGNDAG